MFRIGWLQQSSQWSGADAKPRKKCCTSILQPRHGSGRKGTAAIVISSVARRTVSAPRGESGSDRDGKLSSERGSHRESNRSNISKQRLKARIPVVQQVRLKHLSRPAGTLYDHMKCPFNEVCRGDLHFHMFAWLII